jgi:hypothetical protein
LVKRNAIIDIKFATIERRVTRLLTGQEIEPGCNFSLSALELLIGLRLCDGRTDII